MQEPDDRLFPGALASFRSGLVLQSGGCHSAAILDRPRLMEQLTRFHQAVGGPWQPACSLWAQLYFNTLLIPATCLLSDEADRLGRATTITASFCPASGAPRRFTLHMSRPDQHQPCPASGLADCIGLDVTAVIADVSAVGHLSKRLLQESARNARSLGPWIRSGLLNPRALPLWHQDPRKRAGATFHR